MRAKSVLNFGRILAVLMVTTVLTSMNEPVQAGSNGQQLEVNICYATSFTVSGTNQRQPPEKVSKTVRTDPTGCATYRVEKWWWVGETTITANFADETTERITVNIPRQQVSSDWYAVIFRRNISVERGYKWVYLDPYYDWSTYLNVGQSTKNNLVTIKDPQKPGYYRMDCSGFLSYAWNITTVPSPDTKSLHENYSYQIRVDELLPGDAVINPLQGENGHAILFVNWIDKSRYIFVGYDQFRWVRTDGSLVDQGARYQQYQFQGVSGSKGKLYYYYGNSSSPTGSYDWYADRKR